MPPFNFENPLSGLLPRSAGRDGCIVCGTDFSANSAAAADTALAVAKRLRLPLLLVHSMAETFRDELPVTARAALAPLLSERLRAEAGRLEARGGSVEMVILGGLPDDGLANFAHDRGAVLLVVGNTEHEFAERCLNGNVAEVLAESSPVPTLVVRSAAPFEEWTREARPLRVLVAADLEPVSAAAIRWVNELRRIGPCDVTVVQVTRASGGEALRRQQAQLREKVVDLLGGEDVALHVVPATGRVHRQILALVVDTQAELLVVGTHQRHGVGRLLHPSVSRAVLRHSPVNVVCVPSPVAAASFEPDELIVLS